MRPACNLLPSVTLFSSQTQSRHLKHVDAPAPSVSVLRSPEGQLGVAALTIGLIVGVVLVAPLPLWAGQPLGPPPPTLSTTTTTALAPAPDWTGLLVAAAFVLGLCLPFRPYVHALNLAGRVRSMPVLLALTGAVALVALLIYPRFGSDIFDYVGFERAWVVYGDNPLLALPASHPADWSTPFVWYPTQPPAYGPLWAIVTWPIVAVLGGSATLAVLGYKLLALAAYVACCYLVWSIAEPSRRQRALVLFGWSPLVLFETLGKVHNDILVALGALAAVWLVTRGRRHTGVLVAVAATLVKLTALPIAAVLSARILRQAGRGAGLVALSSAALLIVGAYLPFWAGWPTLQPIVHQTARLVWSPATLLIVAADLLPGSGNDRYVRIGLALLWLIAGACIMRRAQLNSAAEVAAASTRLLLVTLLLLTTAVFGHYLVPAIALMAISAERRLEGWVLLLSIGGMAAYATDVLSLTFGPAWLGSTGYQITGSLVLLGPLALAALFTGRHRASGWRWPRG